ncbi:MAG: hypothetical protein WAM09_03275 [Anaerolineales bacterium]
MCARFHVQLLTIEAPQGYQMAQQVILVGVWGAVLSPIAKVIKTAGVR